MNLDPHMKQLADVLVGICVRELHTAHAGNKNARPVDGWTSNNLERENDNREIEEKHTLQELR